MKKNNIILAPGFDDNDNNDTTYRQWTKFHVGGKDEFFRFMTTPSVERDAFVELLGCFMYVTAIGNINTCKQAMQ